MAAPVAESRCGGIGGGVSVSPTSSFVDRNACGCLQRPPLPLGTALWLCHMDREGRLSWESFSQKGTSNPKIYKLLEKRVTENCGLNFGASLCFVSLSKCSWSEWMVTGILINQRYQYCSARPVRAWSIFLWNSLALTSAVVQHGAGHCLWAGVVRGEGNPLHACACV